MNSIHLAGYDVPIERPSSFAVEQDVREAYDTERNRARLLAACIGLCWAHPARKLRASYSAASFDVFAYGGQVYDELLNRFKADPGAVIEAGVTCFQLILGLEPGQVGEDDAPKAEPVTVEERARFFDPSVAESTG